MQQKLKKQTSNRSTTTPKVIPYDAKIDSKRRIVLRAPKYQHYQVYERPDGSLILTPKVLVDAPISEETKKLIKSSVSQLKKGKASKPIHLDRYLPRK